MEPIVLRSQGYVGVQRHEMLLVDSVDAHLTGAHDVTHLAEQAEMPGVGMDFELLKMGSSWRGIGGDR